jgi:ABC-type dipeptide/oligopeptide/nickel transport system permease component
VIRKILAVLVGLFTAVATVAVVERLGHFVFPPPENIDYSDMAAVKAMLKSMPVAAFSFVLAAWFLGTFIGSSIGLLIAKSRHFWFAATISVLMLVAAVVTTVSIPHPFWFVATAIVGIPISGWLAWRLRQ